MENKTILNNKGFSLLEMMVCLVILGLVMQAMGQTFHFFNQERVLMTSKMEAYGLANEFHARLSSTQCEGVIGKNQKIFVGQAEQITNLPSFEGQEASLHLPDGTHLWPLPYKFENSRLVLESAKYANFEDVAGNNLNNLLDIRVNGYSSSSVRILSRLYNPKFFSFLGL